MLSAGITTYNNSISASQTSASAVIAQDLAAEPRIGNIPEHIVPANIAVVEARNNYSDKNNNNRTNNNNHTEPSETNSQKYTSKITSINISSYSARFSVPFFAQLLAQTPAIMQNSLIYDFSAMGADYKDNNFAINSAVISAKITASNSYNAKYRKNRQINQYSYTSGNNSNINSLNSITSGIRAYINAMSL